MCDFHNCIFIITGSVFAVIALDLGIDPDSHPCGFDKIAPEQGFATGSETFFIIGFTALMNPWHQADIIGEF